MVGLLDLRARDQSNVMRAKRRGMFSDWRLCRFFQSGEESQCGWCVVFSFASLSLSLSELEFLVCRVVCLLLIWPRCQEICLLYRFPLLIGSNWVFFVFFTTKVTKNWPKNYFWLLLFIDKFHRHLAIRWSYVQKPLFLFWRKSQHR